MRERTSKAKWAWVSLGILLLCAAITTLIKTSTTPQSTLSGGFRGWGAPLRPWPDRPTAIIGLTNRTPFSVRVLTASIERRSGDGWMPEELARVAELVDSGEVYPFRVPVLTTSDVWRVTFVCQERSSGQLQETLARSKALVRRLCGKRPGYPDYDYQGRIYHLTNEVGPQ